MVLDPNSKIGFILSFKQTMFALTDILRVFPKDSEKSVLFFNQQFPSLQQYKQEQIVLKRSARLNLDPGRGD